MSRLTTKQRRARARRRLIVRVREAVHSLLHDLFYVESHCP